MSARGRTYRVPKRVADAVHRGIQDYMALSVRRDGDAEALRMAQTLVSDEPVEIGVPVAVGTFFSDKWEWQEEKQRLKDLYGGDAGREWALKCTVAAGLVAAVDPEDGPGAGLLRGWVDDPDDLMDALMMSADEVAAMISSSLDDDDVPWAGDAAEPVGSEVAPAGAEEFGSAVPEATGVAVVAAAAPVRARLEPSPQLVPDSWGRLEAYREWAMERLGSGS